MGKYVVGNKVYVLSEILQVDADDSTKYKVSTDKARFYVTEKGDTLVTDPEQDLVTGTEVYNLITNLARMEQSEFVSIFEIYNSTHGTDYNYSNIDNLLDDTNMNLNTLLEIYNYYKETNTIKVGDIVRVIVKGDNNSKYCGVLHIEYNSLKTIYTLYDADQDYIYHLDKTEAQIIRYNVAGKESAPIESLIKTIKENISGVTKDIDRQHDDPGE